MQQNGEAIYGTEPWSRAEGETDQQIPVRFTQKSGRFYATLMGVPKSGSITLRDVHAAAGSHVMLLGEAKPLRWVQKGRRSGAVASDAAGQVRIRAADGTRCLSSSDRTLITGTELTVASAASPCRSRRNA